MDVSKALKEIHERLIVLFDTQQDECLEQMLNDTDALLIQARQIGDKTALDEIQRFRRKWVDAEDKSDLINQPTK